MPGTRGVFVLFGGQSSEEVFKQSIALDVADIADEVASVVEGIAALPINPALVPNKPTTPIVKFAKVETNKPVAIKRLMFEWSAKKPFTNFPIA